MIKELFSNYKAKLRNFLGAIIPVTVVLLVVLFIFVEDWIVILGAIFGLVISIPIGLLTFIVLKRTGQLPNQYRSYQGREEVIALEEEEEEAEYEIALNVPLFGEEEEEEEEEFDVLIEEK